MNDREAYEYYLDPEHLKPAGPAVRRRGQHLTSMSSVRFAPEVIEAVRERASREGVTVGSWIRRLVQGEIEPAEYAEIHVDGLDAPLSVRAQSLRDVLGAMMPPLSATGQPIDLRVGLASAAISRDGVRLTANFSITAKLASPERPAGITEGSGRRGEPRALTSSLQMRPQTFTCPHFSIGNVVAASCEQCGPLAGCGVKMPCLICRLPVDMDFPVLGRLIYRHVNRVARRAARAQREAERKAPYEAGAFMGIKLIVDEDQEPGTAALVGADGQQVTIVGLGTDPQS